MTGIEFDDRVKHGIGVRVQRFPVGDGLIPLQRSGIAIGRVMSGSQWTAFDIVDGLLIDRDQPGSGTGLNGHIAHGHATFHAQGLNGSASKFNRVACAPGRADFSDDRQHDVFSTAAFGQRAVNQNQHVFGFFGQQCLSRHHVFDFTGPNAVGKGTKGTMGGGVGVSAYHRHAG